ncbi:hypothetical protein BX600DRAFT_447830 [Xylariales sp. PMI_506]|nr:hypothetical protein BX600DRAFT_447830 [Xylariales sp. PMI_506]
MTTDSAPPSPNWCTIVCIFIWIIDRALAYGWGGRVSIGPSAGATSAAGAGAGDPYLAGVVLPQSWQLLKALLQKPTSSVDLHPRLLRHGSPVRRESDHGERINLVMSFYYVCRSERQVWLFLYNLHSPVVVS